MGIMWRLLVWPCLRSAVTKSYCSLMSRLHIYNKWICEFVQILNEEMFTYCTLEPRENNSGHLGWKTDDNMVHGESDIHTFRRLVPYQINLMSVAGLLQENMLLNQIASVSRIPRYFYSLIFLAVLISFSYFAFTSTADDTYQHVSEVN